ncbi:DUF4232 domain-containing protein [Kitasatospora aureofaciens]|uniref:DUF4232 domain-containing protein n=1 Tax=Kitasatospora aureofaciens TaxID=1894 RepID=UPI0036F45427
MEMKFPVAARASVAASAITLALTATACGGSANQSGKSVSSSFTATPTAASPGAFDTTSPTPDVAGRTPPSLPTPEALPTAPYASPGSSSPNAPALGTKQNVKQPSFPPCSEANSKLSVDPVARPLNHLLLTVTNTGTTACNAYHAPLLRFDQAVEAIQILASSQPQAVVTLAPGASAYAAINTSSADGGGTGAFMAGQVQVTSVDGIGSAGATTTLRLPRPTHVDSAAFATYWQGSSTDALAW